DCVHGPRVLIGRASHALTTHRMGFLFQILDTLGPSTVLPLIQPVPCDSPDALEVLFHTVEAIKHPLFHPSLLLRITPVLANIAPGTGSGVHRERSCHKTHA